MTFLIFFFYQSALIFGPSQYTLKKLMYIHIVDINALWKKSSNTWYFYLQLMIIQSCLTQWDMLQREPN